MSARSSLPYGSESYAHLGAKRLLLGWLRESAEAVGCDGRADFAGLNWRVNRPGPAWGVWEELPIISDGCGADPVWDETDPRWLARPPSYDEVIGLGLRPMAVVDIAIQHKGRIAFAVEVRHKHPVTPPKLGFLRKIGVDVIEVPAHWVLGQVCRPSEIPAEFFL